jgi:hypothetical protein
MTLATQRLKNETIQPFRLPGHGNPAGGLTVHGRRGLRFLRALPDGETPPSTLLHERLFWRSDRPPCKGLQPWKGSSTP